MFQTNPLKRTTAMKIFIGYSFCKGNNWIRELAFPLVETFDGKWIDGEEIPGKVITDEVKKRIDGAKAVIGILTKDEEPKKKSPSEWVLSELSYAIGKGKPVAVLKDKRLPDLKGLLADRQRIDFDTADKATLMLRLAGLLFGWSKDFRAIRVYLQPKDITDELHTWLLKDDTLFKCYWQSQVGIESPSEEKEAALRQRSDAICIELAGFPTDDHAQIKLRIEGGGFRWQTQGFVPIKTYSQIIKP